MMNSKVLFWKYFTGLAVFSLLALGASSRTAKADKPERIITTAPSVTETLFALGLGDRVVGVSRFCTYPPEVVKLPKIGGLLDPNWEAAAALRPTTVVTLTTNKEHIDKFTRMGLKVITVDHRTLSGVLDSFESLGKEFGPEYAATGKKLRAEIQKKLDAVSARIGVSGGSESSGQKSPRVLICIDRMRGVGKIQNLFIAGNNPFFDDVLRYAGGTNAGRNPEGIAVPTLSAEQVLRMNPDVIIDLLTGVNEVASATDRAEKERLLKKTLDDWKSINGLTAVRNDRVYLLTEDYATVPGPRIVTFVEHLARLLHPEKSEPRP